MNNNDIIRKLEKKQKEAFVNALCMQIRRLTDFTSLTLLIAFVTLKLTDVIGWSWWWVVSPWWIALIFNITLRFSIKYFVNKKYGIYKGIR